MSVVTNALPLKKPNTWILHDSVLKRSRQCPHSEENDSLAKWMVCHWSLEADMSSNTKLLTGDTLRRLLLCLACILHGRLCVLQSHSLVIQNALGPEAKMGAG